LGSQISNYAVYIGLPPPDRAPDSQWADWPSPIAQFISDRFSWDFQAIGEFDDI